MITGNCPWNQPCDRGRDHEPRSGRWVEPKGGQSAEWATEAIGTKSLWSLVLRRFVETVGREL